MTFPKSSRRKRNIEWSNLSWNWMSGCTGPCGDGVHCPGCYAKSMARRLAGRHGYPERPDHFKVTLHPDKLYRDQGHPGHPGLIPRPKIIFNVSMGDWMDAEVEWREEACRVMQRNQQHIFMTLTKKYDQLGKIPANFDDGYIPENVWVLISVSYERQLWGIDKLKELDAAVLGISAEPLMQDLAPKIDFNGIDLVIIGGRTKHDGIPAFRPEKKWVTDLVDKAHDAGASIFLKPKLEYVPRWYEEPIEELPFHLMSEESPWRPTVEDYKRHQDRIIKKVLGG